MVDHIQEVRVVGSFEWGDKKYTIDETLKACKHPGCSSHVTHPCEKCGYMANRISIEKGSMDFSKAKGIDEVANAVEKALKSECDLKDLNLSTCNQMRELGECDCN